jgi:Pvc16 N-terminal domain/Carboxypeptidase regulatory-like domain
VINYIDAILRGVLLARVPGLTTQLIGFQPPNPDWRTRVGTSGGISVNVYLVDITEDRGLRSNARHREVMNGVTRETKAPERVRLHYVVSAWNSAKDSLQVRATEAEHAVLAAVLGALIRAAPLNPARLLTNTELGALPAELRDIELPTRIIPPDGFPRLAEFWGTMGRPQALRPVIYLMVTAPLIHPIEDVGGIVDTILMDVGRAAGVLDPPAELERVLVIGGVVLDGRPPHAAAPVPVAGARVDLQSSTGTFRAATTTGPTGEFSFAGIEPGSYRLAYSHAVIPAHAPQPLTVPVASGPIELLFT